ncbi:MAG: 3-dehydroquinate synthase [Vampirovibrionales bacterium]|jgi:3-dehydroquinate synthase
MRLESLTVQSNIKSYTVSFEETTAFVEQLATLENAVFVVDARVWELHQHSTLVALPAEKVILQTAEEAHKNIESVCALYEKIMAYAPRKNLNLVSIGGGIIQDITGFVASSLYRGVNWIFVPTTFLAQVDSCIGAKTSLNFKQYKNLVGTFYPPSQIHLFPGFLDTLSDYDYYSGVGEMAKLHLLDGETATHAMLTDLPALHAREPLTVLRRSQACLAIKKAYIEDDEFDTGRRNLLNYGHCFGHAIESACDFAMSHGQAVVLGMILANQEALERGLLSTENEALVREKILMPILRPESQAVRFDVEEAVAAMGQDKKNLGKGLALVMLNDAFEGVKITDMIPETARTRMQAWQETRLAGLLNKR